MTSICIIGNKAYTFEPPSNAEVRCFADLCYIKHKTTESIKILRFAFIGTRPCFSSGATTIMLTPVAGMATFVGDEILPPEGAITMINRGNYYITQSGLFYEHMQASPGDQIWLTHADGIYSIVSGGQSKAVKMRQLDPQTSHP